MALVTQSNVSGGGGGSDTSALLSFSPTDVFPIRSAFHADSGETVGTQFCIRPGLLAIQITGIRFYWNSAGGETIKCSLYDPTAGSLATITIVTSGVGPYTATFASPYVVPPADYQLLLTAAIFETTLGTFFWVGGNGPPINTFTPALPFFGGRRLVWSRFNRFAVGDGNPNLDGGNAWVPIEPVLAEIP